MSSKNQIAIPQAASWLIRLAAHPKLSDPAVLIIERPADVL
jgi:hypothetical protein